MPAKPTHSSAGHRPGMGKKQPAAVKPTETSAEAEAAEEEVLEVRRWEGEIDAEALNDELLKLMRETDGRPGWLGLSENARRHAPPGNRRRDAGAKFLLPQTRSGLI